MIRRSGAPAALDPWDARLALRMPASLEPFARAGVLASADVHVARRLAELAGERDELVALALALAVRAPRLGHVHVDLRRISQTAAAESEEPLDLRELPWPALDEWLQRLSCSVLLRDGGPAEAPPLRLDGELLYLDRYWRLELQLADDISASAAAIEDVSLEVLADGIKRLFGEQRSERQAQAAASAVLQRFCVIAGGPGTGKTTTVARIAALLCEQAQATGSRWPRIALAAPTGRAAARLEQAIHEAADHLAVSEAVRARLRTLRAGTIHRLLGARADSRSRFRHNRRQRLPHDAVIVDECSMVSLALMARLLEAVRPAARVVLVGDPDQLSSIEAGAVLGDITGPAALAPCLSEAAVRRLQRALGRPVHCRPRPPKAIPADGVIALERVHRFGTQIAALARAVRAGEADRVVALLSESPEEMTWLALDTAEVDDDSLAPLRAVIVACGAKLIEHARAGDAAAALSMLSGFRLLCAHRRGPYGVARWTGIVESWLERAIDGEPLEGVWYAGRPLLVCENDYELELFNGDLGVVVADPDGGEPSAVFQRRGALAAWRPARLGAVQTAHALTVHKSQGSQFEQVAVLLPDASSPLLTRELLYTAITRARRRVMLIGSEESLRRAVQRPIARATGLRKRLWGAEGRVLTDAARRPPGGLSR